MSLLYNNNKNIIFSICLQHKGITHSFNVFTIYMIQCKFLESLPVTHTDTVI